MPLTPVTAADLSRVVKLLIMTPPSWVLPVDGLLPVASVLRSWGVRRSAFPSLAETALARTLSDHVTPHQASEIIWSLADNVLAAHMQILAMNRPDRRWQPAIRWHGMNNIAEALERRSGAILWVSDFAYSSLVTKIALHRAGIAVSHLSRPNHGFSVSPFGIRFLNPLWTRVETRYLAERVVIAGDSASEALNVLRARLASNRVVSITVAETGRRTLDAKFFRGSIRIATGPAHLARTSRAPLLPVFTVRGEEGVYEVTIGQPLDVDNISEANYAVAVQAYVRMLEPFALRHPNQWNGWVVLGHLAEQDRARVSRGQDR